MQHGSIHSTNDGKQFDSHNYNDIGTLIQGLLITNQVGIYIFTHKNNDIQLYTTSKKLNRNVKT